MIDQLVIDRYVAWAIAHPVIACIETILTIYVAIKIPTVLLLIPGMIEEMRDRRRSRLLRAEEERRKTYKG